MTGDAARASEREREREINHEVKGGAVSGVVRATV